MSFVGELLDVNIEKEMSEEVKDFKYGGTQEDGTTCNSTCTCIQTYHLCLDTWCGSAGLRGVDFKRSLKRLQKRP